MVSQPLNPISESESDPNSEVIQEFRFFKVLKNGQVNVFPPQPKKIPPADDPLTGVKIKDVKISSDVSARIFLPPSASSAPDAGKLPVVFYVHGGGFCMRSAFDVEYTSLLTEISTGGEILAVSIDYGLFPTRPIPACYEDSWEALQWVVSHSEGSGPEPWLNKHADFGRLFLVGDSAGANICHTLAVRAGSIGLPAGVAVVGMVLVHPFFGENDAMWMYMCPTNEGPKDRRMKAAAEDLAWVAAKRVLVIVAEKDRLREAGKKYPAELKESGWKGMVELVENKSRCHCFHLSNPKDEVAVANLRRILSFILMYNR